MEMEMEWLPSLPSQRLVISTLDDTDFGGKVDFEGRKTGEPEEKSSKSDWDQPISAHVRAQDRTRVAVVGGAVDDHRAKPDSPYLLQVNRVFTVSTWKAITTKSVHIQH